jgi:large subunit ribosomal protein L16
VKAGRVIVELGGHCEFEEVKFFLESVALKLPCYAWATSQEELGEYEQKLAELQAQNINPITKERVARLKMNDSKLVMSNYDKLWNFNYEYS